MTRSITALGAIFLFCTTLPTLATDHLSSEVLTTDAGERILYHQVILDAPRDIVWQAYSTAEGWRAWVAPLAEVDLRVGGTIRTNYNPEGELGDASTNTLTIVNYVPETLLTLRAELSKNWPKILQEDAENLTNVLLFEELSDSKTRLRSYGIGYRDRPEYDELMTFFIQANEKLYRGLQDYVAQQRTQP
ncbi:MAG: SRPBCC domain-containing protein [Acidobacteriota bacterium]